MKYDFTSDIDRRGMDSIAADVVRFPGALVDAQVDEGFDIIPMWVADMAFATPPTVTQAILERMKHPVFGYFQLREEYFESIISWHEKRNGIKDLKKEYIGYENSVLGGVISAVNVMTSRGGSVLVHSPTYVGFTNSLKNNGYNIVHSRLKLDESGIYRMDFDDMEQKIKQNDIHTAILCSPHNPCGRVWERWELEMAMELFRKYDVAVVSDEIWSDIVFEGNKHIPTQSVSEDAKNRTVALYAPTKTFNLAGFVGSYHVIYNKYLRDRVNKEASLSHYNEVNIMSMYALIGAYKPQGHEWVDELCSVLSENVEYACDYISQHFSGVKFSVPQGTYMLFLDCSEWCKLHGKTIEELQKAGMRVGVIWQDGRAFNGECHIRINLALPKEKLKEALLRLDRYVFN